VDQTKLCYDKVYKLVMVFLVAFPFLLVSLFFLSRIFTTHFSLAIHKFTKSQKWTITLFALFFLPGVIFHELAHLIIHTGEVEFIPKITGNSLKLGSVAIAKTDPIRRFLIGAAPLFCGLGLMIGLLILLQPFKEIGQSQAPLGSWESALFFYVIFQIGNTMFSSKKDMEGAAVFLILVFAVGGSIFIFDKNLIFQFYQYISSAKAVLFWEEGDILLAIIILIDGLVVLASRRLIK